MFWAASSLIMKLVERTHAQRTKNLKIYDTTFCLLNTVVFVCLCVFVTCDV